MSPKYVQSEQTKPDFSSIAIERKIILELTSVALSDLIVNALYKVCSDIPELEVLIHFNKKRWYNPFSKHRIIVDLHGLPASVAKAYVSIELFANMWYREFLKQRK